MQVKQGSGDVASWGYCRQENMPFIVDSRWRHYIGDLKGVESTIAPALPFPSQERLVSQMVPARILDSVGPRKGRIRRFLTPAPVSISSSSGFE